jgi:PiT family inorganic phosphate transporter
MVVESQTELCCSSCQKPLTTAGAPTTCPSCATPYHGECWATLPTCTCGKPNLLAAPTPAVPRDTAQPLWPWLIGGTLVLIALAIGMALQMGVAMKMVLIICVVAAALIFDYVNGMHDAGNAIATVISTRVLSPAAALTMAAVLNLVGALIHGGLALSIATKFADMSKITPDQITLLMILCGLVGASTWSYLTASWGLPVSTSHSLFGGLIGVFVLGGIPLNMEYVGKIGLFIVLAPVLAFSAGWLLMVIFMWCFHKCPPYTLNRYFRGLQVFSAASMAFSHGSNDAQKAMGIITLALAAGGFINASGPEGVVVPLWVKIACAVVIALGTGFGGMRVIRTLGHKIIRLDPIHGFTAETVAAATIQLVTFLHIPISTTQVISSSILGIGASKRLSAVRWGVAKNIVLAWIITIPTCAAAGALLYAIVRWCTGMR